MDINNWRELMKQDNMKLKKMYFPQCLIDQINERVKPGDNFSQVCRDLIRKGLKEKTQ